MLTRPTPVGSSAPNCGDAASPRSSPNRQIRLHTVNDAAHAADARRPSTLPITSGRNVIERGFNAIKQWRGLATRYDKLAITYRAAAVLHAITVWTAHLSDTP